MIYRMVLAGFMMFRNGFSRFCRMDLASFRMFYGVVLAGFIGWFLAGFMMFRNGFRKFCRIVLAGFRMFYGMVLWDGFRRF